MASLSQEPSAPPEIPDETIRRLTAELREARDQQAAVTEILQVINSSSGDLAPVFDAILDKAIALCEAAHGSMQLYDGQQFRAVAVRGLPEPLADLLRGGVRPSPEAPMWGLLAGDRFVHVPDLTKLDIPEVRFAVEHGSRTTLHIRARPWSSRPQPPKYCRSSIPRPAISRPCSTQYWRKQRGFAKHPLAFSEPGMASASISSLHKATRSSPSWRGIMVRGHRPMIPLRRGG